MFFAFDTVHFFEGEELPVDYDPVLPTHFSDPLGSLVGVRAEDVEVKVDCGCVWSHALFYRVVSRHGQLAKACLEPRTSENFEVSRI